MGDGWFLVEYDSTPNIALKSVNPEKYWKLHEDNKRMCEGRPCSIAIAVAITANARVELFKTINKMDELGIDVLYMDTDALVLSKPMPKEYLGDGLGQFKNELADASYSIENDHEYYMKDPVFLRDKVYGYKTKDDKIKIKFSGYKRSDIHDGLYDEMLKVVNNEKDSINVVSNFIRKNLDDLNINQTSGSKTFTFNYVKRNPIYIDGKWVHTEPLSVGMGDDTERKLIIYKNRMEDPEAKTSLKYNEPLDINTDNIFDNDFKMFTGGYINYYWKESNGSLLRDWIKHNKIQYYIPDFVKRDKLEAYILAHTWYLSGLIRMAEAEGLLKVGSRFMITEGFKDPENNIIRYRTVWYMESYSDHDTLIHKYCQHLIEQLEWYEDAYSLDEIYLRIKIPRTVLNKGSVIKKNTKYIFKLNK